MYEISDLNSCFGVGCITSWNTAAYTRNQIHCPLDIHGEFSDTPKHQKYCYFELEAYRRESYNIAFLRVTINSYAVVIL